jgi:secreted trypsin-like serine protease
MRSMLVAVQLALLGIAYGQSQCGQTPVAPNVGRAHPKNIHGEIVGGTVATPYSWPWQIVWCTGGGFNAQCRLECGGTVISEGWVMTAGHCVYGQTNRPQSFRVKAGVFNNAAVNETGEQFVGVKSIRLHPQYRPNPVPQWDVALIELETPLTFTDHVQPVCLPAMDSDALADGNSVWVTGWGTTSEGGSISANLRQVQVPMVSNATCTREYRNDFHPDTMFCAGVAGKDSCQGDSGGPVVAQINGAWSQYGIVSWGQGCAEANYAGVYSRVSAYCPFIASTTMGAVQCQ